jgi:hypothetical protein
MKKFLGIVAVAGAILMLAGSAQARVAQPAERLRLEEHDTGSGAWQRGVSDSPKDAGHQRVKLAVAEQTGDYDYVVVVAPRSGVRGPIDEVGHLGFDVLTRTYVGAGAPRISVDIDTNGDGEAELYAYLSAFHCQRNYVGSDWARANFTERKALGCAIYTNEPTGSPYESTGTQSAWDVFAAAHPGAEVLSAYMVQDEVGQAFVDRIVIGHRMFPSANQVVELA